MNAITQYLVRHALSMAIAEAQQELQSEGPEVIAKVSGWLSDELAELTGSPAPAPAGTPEPTPPAAPTPAVAESPRAAAAQPVQVGTNVTIH